MSAAIDAKSAPPVVSARHLVGGEWVAGDRHELRIDPYRGDVVTEVARGTPDILDRALGAARETAPRVARLPGYRRAEILHRVAKLIVERSEAVGELMARETGKAVKDAVAEVRRSQDTITLSAEESIRIEGSHVPLEGSEMGAGKLAFMLRVPVGVVAAITPFNAPFNLACHKLGPALAAGNAVVLKPPPQAAGVVQMLVEMFVEAGTPAGAVNVVQGGVEIGRALVRDPRVDFITFTGSSRAGLDIKAASGLKRVALELGGNGHTIVHEDGDIAVAAPLCARNAMRLAGQSCISVQTVLVHRSLFDPFRDRVIAEVKALKVGDPLDPATDVGTLIDEDAARRVESWVAEARAEGAAVLTGGSRSGAQLQPAVVTDAQPSMKVVCDEVFGPVVTLLAYDALDDAFDLVNRGTYGLQCGIFTASNAVTLRAIREIRAGGVIINGTSTWRTDQLPYGGVKDSGIGREGPRYAIRDMTDERLVVFNM